MLRRPRIECVLPICPKPQARTRSRTKTGHHYTPKPMQRWRGACAAIMAQHTPSEPLDGVLIGDLLFVMPRPGHMHKTDKHGRPKFPAGLIFRAKTPDVDNLYKACTDVGTMVKWWKDDCHIVCGTMLRAIAEIDGQPRIEVMVSEARDTPEVIWDDLRRKRGAQQRSRQR